MPVAFLACSASRVLELNTKIEPNLNGSIKNNVDGGLSWICFTLGKFCFCNFVAISSIFSLSGLTSCHPSANPLEPRPNFVRWGSAPLTQTLYTSYNNVVKVSIMEPHDNKILSRKNNVVNLYQNIVSIMRESTNEYYNMRMILKR